MYNNKQKLSQSERTPLKISQHCSCLTLFIDQHENKTKIKMEKNSSLSVPCGIR